LRDVSDFLEALYKRLAQLFFGCTHRVRGYAYSLWVDLDGRESLSDCLAECIETGAIKWATSDGILGLNSRLSPFAQLMPDLMAKDPWSCIAMSIFMPNFHAVSAMDRAFDETIFCVAEFGISITMDRFFSLNSAFRESSVQPME